MKLALFLLALLSVSFCNLTVINYPELSKKISPIKYSIANFGQIPYGVRSSGKLVVADPIKACDSLFEYNGDDEEQQQQQDRDQLNSFILVKRGDCTFVTKALNAEKAGAKLVIIVDDQRDEDATKIVMGDDGNGDNVNIPTIFINAADGKKLEDLYYAMQGQNEIQKNQDKVQLSIDFHKQQSEYADVKLFINPPLQQNFHLMNSFFHEYEAIKDKTYISPVYQIYSCVGCKEAESNCIRNGRYCAIDADGADKAGTGKQLIEEYLFQLCVHDIYGTETWWNYVKIQHSKCHQLPTLHECAIEQSKTTNIQEDAVNGCVNRHKFNDDEPIQMLEEQIDIIERTGVFFFPNVSINNVKYKGSILGTDVLEAVCATIQDPSKRCKQLINKFADIEGGSSDYSNGPDVTLIVAIVVGVLVLFFLFMIFVYRRMVTKDMHKEVNAEVSQMVSQYIAFYESRDSKRDNNEETV